MKVLVVGGGGREHTLAWKIARSPKVSKVYCAPGNAGTAEIAENIDIKVDDINGLLEFAKKESVDLTVVGPELPLVLGVVDVFEESGLKIFGPSKGAAELEGSKVFMNDVLKMAGVPTASFKVFNDEDSAVSYLHNVQTFPIVVKADGLAAGKGVLVAPDRDSAVAFVKEVMSEKIFGDAGNSVVIEECLEGEEASYIVVADGTDFISLATSQDHKRIGDGDTGNNTGGMGAYSPAPIITATLKDKIDTWVIKPLLEEMESRGIPFRGFLYAGLMISNAEVYALEFNVRLGDPETEPILIRYSGDFVELILSAVDGDLKNFKEPEWEENSSVCVVMASGGYPAKYETGKKISGLDDTIDGVEVFHAGTALKDGDVVTSGGRVLGITATAPTIKEAIELAYKRIDTISFEGAVYRKDIGLKALNRQCPLP